MKTELGTIGSNSILTPEGNVKKQSNMDLDHTLVVVESVGYELSELIDEGSF